MSRAVGILSIGLVLVASLARADDLKTLGAKTVSGTVTEINDKEITIKTEAGPVKTPLSQVLTLDLRPAKGAPTEGKYAAVRLLDDTTLHCKNVVFKGKDVELTLTSTDASFTVPLNFVVSILQDAGNIPIRKQFEQFGGLGAGEKSDRIFILKGADLNPLAGTLGDIDLKEGTIAFKYGNETLPIKLDKLHGMFFYRSEVPEFTPVCRVIDVDGNTLVAAKLGYDGTTLTLTTGFGAKIPLTSAALAKLDFNLGKLTFLSDLEPAGVIEKSGIGLITRYKRDANLDGEPILLEKQYAKGLSIHSHTELEYKLAGKYKEFKALLGVDTRTGADSKALVTIICDGEKRFSQVVNVKTSQPVMLNVKDVQILKIVVSSQNFLDLHDHATLADARVSQ